MDGYFFLHLENQIIFRFRFCELHSYTQTDVHLHIFFLYILCARILMQHLNLKFPEIHTFFCYFGDRCVRTRNCCEGGEQVKASQVYKSKSNGRLQLLQRLNLTIRSKVVGLRSVFGKLNVDQNST